MGYQKNGHGRGVCETTPLLRGSVFIRLLRETKDTRRIYWSISRTQTPKVRLHQHGSPRREIPVGKSAHPHRQAPDCGVGGARGGRCSFDPRAGGARRAKDLGHDDLHVGVKQLSRRSGSFGASLPRRKSVKCKEGQIKCSVRLKHGESYRACASAKTNTSVTCKI